MREGSHTDEPARTKQPPTVEALEAALEAERARTREADHRAKNTLQLIASLLFLLSRRSPDEATRTAMKAMHQRVNAMAAVHRNLLASGRPDRIDLTQLVREQVTSLVQSHGEGAAVRLELDPVDVEPAAAGPLALILNELTLNALSHAGDGGHAPAVTVGLRRAGTGFNLAVQDDGPGPETVKTEGFGLTMVRLLAQQLGARFGVENAQPGLRAVVSVG